jgi:hypothetical protein
MPSKTQTTEYVILKCYCPKCKAYNFVSIEYTTWTKKGIEEPLDVWLWTCTQCDTLLNLTKIPKVKEWYSEKELVAIGYAKLSKSETNKYFTKRYMQIRKAIRRAAHND